MNIGKLAKIIEYLSVNGYDEESIALGHDVMFFGGPAPISKVGLYLTSLGASWSYEYECWEVLF